MYNGKKGRQQNALNRLEKQLKIGKKNVYDSKTKKTSEEELNESDIKRINKDIETLKARVI